MDTDDDISTLEDEEVPITDPSTSSWLLKGKIGTSQETVKEGTRNEEKEEESRDQRIRLADDVECKMVVQYVINSAKILTLKEERFVVYMIEAQEFPECPSVTSNEISSKPVTNKCAKFERRYSEFHAVYSALLESHRSLMEGFQGFPKKVLIGNFSTEVTHERCIGLARFLNFVQQEGVLSRTAVFSKFLYKFEVELSNDLLLHSNFEDAWPILENTFILLDILHWDTGLMLRILCQLIVSQHSVSEYERSFTYAQIALKKFKVPANRKIVKELYIPFLLFCDNLWRILGKDRSEIKLQIDQIRKQKKQEECVPNLLDVLRDEIALRTLH